MVPFLRDDGRVAAHSSEFYAIIGPDEWCDLPARKYGNRLCDRNSMIRERERERADASKAPVVNVGAFRTSLGENFHMWLFTWYEFLQLIKHHQTLMLTGCKRHRERDFCGHMAVGMKPETVGTMLKITW